MTPLWIKELEAWREKHGAEYEATFNWRVLKAKTKRSK